MTEANNTPATRARLLECAAALALERGSALDLQLDAVLAAAKASEAEFHLAFPGRRQFLLALMLHYLDVARAAAIEALAQSQPGVPRIAAAFTDYWEANLRLRPMRELCLHFRTDPEGAEILRARLAGVTVITQHELRSIGWPRAASAARLAAQMCVECAVAEFEARKALPDVRAAVLDYFREPRPAA